MPDRKLYTIESQWNSSAEREIPRQVARQKSHLAIGNRECIVEYIESTPAREHAEELRKALTCAIEYIDAIPKDVALPTMPGFDRDWVNDLLAKTSPEVSHD